jgi:hypothetical protein
MVFAARGNVGPMENAVTMTTAMLDARERPGVVPRLKLPLNVKTRRIAGGPKPAPAQEIKTARKWIPIRMTANGVNVIGFLPGPGAAIIPGPAAMPTTLLSVARLADANGTFPDAMDHPGIAKK